MSAVISDIEQMRTAFSDWMAELFRQVFSLIAFVLVLAFIDWRMALGSAVLIPLVAWPVSKFGRRIRKSSERSRSRLADLSQILHETISGNRVVKAFGMEGFEIRKFREAARNLLAREHALDPRACRHLSADGSARRCCDLDDPACRARRNQKRPPDAGLVRRVHLCAVQGL